MEMSYYLSLFPGASQNKARLMALAELLLQQVIDLAPMASAIMTAFSLDHAVGVQLDDLGASMGFTREDCTDGVNANDQTFRAFLKMKAILWDWDGTNETVPAIVAAITSNVYREIDNMNSTVSISPTGALPGDDKSMLPIPAGIRIAT